MAGRLFWVLACVTLLLGFTGNVLAEPSLEWTHDFHLAPSAWGTTLVAKIHPAALGQVDIVWKDVDTWTRYSRIANGHLAIDAEVAYGSDTHGIMGISRHGGAVRVGLNSNSNALEYTRTAQGAWMGSDTGYDSKTMASAWGGYDLDPCTGLGGFILKDNNNDIVHIYESTLNVWDKLILETNVPSNAWGREGDVVYTPDGDPIGAYKFQYEDPNGNPYFTCCNELRTGRIDGPGPLNPVQDALPDRYLDLAVVPGGKVYLLDNYSSTQSLLQVSVDRGQTWITLGALPTGYGVDNNTDVALAVAPDESLAAVLSWGPHDDPDLRQRTMLWLSEPNDTTGQPLGAEWYADPCLLPGAGTLNKADVAFDPCGYLYVAYYNHGVPTAADEGIHLLSNMPAWPDSDGDGVPDPFDLCPGSDPCFPVDQNGCTDVDEDGVPDPDDLCPGTPPGTQVNADGCPDADGDGVADADDLCPGTLPGYVIDATGCPQQEFFRLQSSTSVYYLKVDGELLNPNSSDFFFESSMRIADPGTEDAISILFSFGGSSEVAWARTYSDGTCQLWDKGDVQTYGSSSGPQHDVEGGATTTGTIVTSPACAPYDGITINLAIIGDEDDDGVPDDVDNCPGTAPGIWVDQFGCPMPDTDGDGIADPCDLCPGSDPCLPVNADGCTDTDQDGVTDTGDLCPDTPGGALVNADGCIDTDQDGVTDPCDDCPGTPPGIMIDARGCPSVFVSVMETSARKWGDYNNDGFSDMFGNTQLYTNNGDGTFTFTTPFISPYGGQATLGDYNNDGLLDHFSLGTYNGGYLYLNNGDETWTFRPDLTSWTFYDTPRNSSGQTCVDLNGDGYLDTYMTGWWDYDQLTSADVIFTSEADGVSDPCWRKTWDEIPYRHCKGVTPCDFDEDGDQDLYVSGYWTNLGHLWRNDGFDGAAGLTDVTLSYGASDGPGHTQGSCWADFDNDGHFDLFIANFAHLGNPTARFMESQGEPDYHFTDKGLCGITQVEPLSCGIAGDYDNDGDVDILITVSGGYSWTTIMMYRNNGDWTFTDITAAVGFDGQGPHDVAAWGDYDNDGYLDLIANDQLWRNPGGDNHWLKVKLLGGPHEDGLVNGAAIGAQVRIDVPGLGALVRQVEGNTGQLGCQNDITMHFGLGTHTDPVDLNIVWPNGYEQTVYGVAVDQAITVQLEPPVTIPLCWDYLTQCHGDTDGDGDVDTVDWPVFRDSFGYSYPAAQYHPCGDMDHDGDVDTVDWPEFRDNFGYTAIADCTPGGTWPPGP